MPIFRIDNVISNMPEFQQAFGCKAGQKHGESQRLPRLVRSYRVIGTRNKGQPQSWPFLLSLLLMCCRDDLAD